MCISCNPMFLRESVAAFCALFPAEYFTFRKILIHGQQADKMMDDFFYMYLMGGEL